jgi:hypothetical protein
MTLAAVCLTMLTNKRKFCQAMVEDNNRLPVLFVVAVTARLAQLVSVRIIITMTINTR